MRHPPAPLESPPIEDVRTSLYPSASVETFLFSQSIDDTANAVLDQRRVEVDQQAETLVGKSEIGQKLFL